MTTVVVDGVPITATEVACDPVPGGSVGTTRLKVEFASFKPKNIEGSVPIVFPFGGDLYRGEFQVVTKDDPPGSGVYTFVANGDVRKWL